MKTRPPQNYDDICRKINWTMLSAQKQTLLKLIGSLPNKHDNDNLDGMINLIDDLQDAAIDAHGVKESEVFPSLIKIRKSKKG